MLTVTTKFKDLYNECWHSDKKNVKTSTLNADIVTMKFKDLYNKCWHSDNKS
jgi:hypothetical protein